MKKIVFIFLLLFLASCGVEKNADYYNHQLEIQKMKAEQLERDRAFELEKLKIQAEAEANKPVEVRVQEKANEVQQEANDSLEYLENSQKARDVIEGAAIGR